MAVLDSLKEAAASFSSAFRLTPEAEKSPRAEIAPDDLATPPKPPDQTEQDLVAEVLAKFKRSSEARVVQELDWRVDLAFDRGNQWIAYKSGQNRLFRITDPEDPNRRFITANQIGHIINDIETALTASEVDVAFTPLTQRPQDVGATAEKRDIWEHVKSINGWRDLVQDLVDAACTTSTSLVEIGFDDQKAASTWTQDASGQIVNKTKDIGDITLTVHPSPSVYPDTDGRDPKDWRYIIIVERVACEYLQETYGVRGVVPPDEGADSLAGYMDLRIDAITGDAIKNSTPDRHSAYLYRYFERPSPKYPKGRYIPIAGKRTMVPVEQCKRLPFKWCWEQDRLPFEAWCYRKKFHTAWGLNAVSDLVDLQAQYNNLLSRTNDMINSERVIIAAPTEANVSSDSFHLQANCEVVEYDGPQAPEITPFPAVTNDRFQMLQTIYTIMQDIAGSHNLLPPQVGANPSGILVDLYNQMDVSGRAQAHHRLETMTARVADAVGLIAQERYDEPRLVYLSRETGQQQEAVAAHDFRHMAAGGMCRIEAKPGSSIMKSPAARQQMILDLFKSTGGFRQEMLPGIVLLLELLNIDYSDDFNQKVDATIKQMMIQAAQQAAAQAAPQAQAAQAALQAKAEHDAATQLQKGQQDQQIQGMKGDQQLALEQAKQTGQGQLLGAEQTFEQIIAESERTHPQVTLALKGDADPTAIVSGERAMGLQAGSIADAKEANAPPVMAPKLNGNGAAPKTGENQ